MSQQDVNTFLKKAYTPEETRALKAQWSRIEAEYRRTGTLPEGVQAMGTVFAMGAAGDARPHIPIIASIDGVPAVAVLEQIEREQPAVAWALRQTFVAVEEMQLPARRSTGSRVIAAAPGQVADVQTNAIERYDPFNPAHANLVFLTPLQGG